MDGVGSPQDLWRLTSQFGKDSTLIAIYLNISTATIENLQSDYPHNAEERAFQMINRWSRGTVASKRRSGLQEAFRKAGREDLVDLLSKSAGFREVNRDDFIQKLKNHVKRRMSKLPLIPWISVGYVNIDQVFTNVQLLINIAAAAFPVRLPMKSHNAIFDDINHIIDSQPCLADLSPVRILLLGRTGSGKTTLLMKYAYDWCMGKEGAVLSKSPVVFILLLRKLDRWSNLGQAVLDQMLPSEKNITAAEIERFCEENPDDVVILLDGYDEFKGKGLDQKDCGNIVKMLRNECFTDCRVVVSTRPARASDFGSEYENYRHLEITGFAPEDIDTYVYKVFYGPHKDLGKKLLDYLEENQLKTELASLPLMLTAFCQLTKWTDGKDFKELNTISKLFDRLIECIFIHWQSKGACSYFDSSSGLSQDGLVLELGKVAAEGFLGGADEELIFCENDFNFRCSQKVIEPGLDVGLICKEENSIMRQPSFQSFQSFQCKNQKLCSETKNMSFVLKSLQEKCAGNYLAHLIEQDGEECGVTFSTYLNRIITEQKVIDLANVLMFASASNKMAATHIMELVIQLFRKGEVGENIKQFLKGKLHFKKCQWIQRLIEFCLQLNFESNSCGCLNHFINDLFGEERRLRLVGVSSYVAKALGYLLSHSFQESSNDREQPSDGTNTLSITSVEIISICLRSSTEFREFLNCYPGVEQYISDYMAKSIDSQSQGLLREQVETSAHEIPEYLSDRPNSTFFAVAPIWQEISKRQVKDFSFGFILPGLQKMYFLEELILNGVKAECKDWIILFEMIRAKAFPNMTNLTLSLNDLVFDQTAVLASALGSATKLKYLKLAGNQVGEGFVENFLAKTLVNLGNLILDRTELPSKAIVQLMKKNDKCPSLHKLDLRRNQDMDDAAMESVCQAVKVRSHCWKELRISLYQVTSSGLDIMKSKLHAPALTHINLVHTPDPDAVIECCASVLPSLPALIDLRISGIPSAKIEAKTSTCSPQTLDSLTIGLASSHCITFMSILYTLMTPGDFLKLLKACGNHRSLKTFRFSRTCVPKDADVESECKTAETTFLKLWV